MQVILDKQYPVGTPPEAAWAVLSDIRALAACMPGAEITGQTDDTHYTGHVKVRVGPATAAFAGTLEVLAVEPESLGLHLIGRGADKGGSTVSMELNASLAPAADGSTLLLGKADVIINGKFAQFGGRMLSSVSDVVLAQFAANFAARSQAGMAPAEAAAITEVDTLDPLAEEVHPHTEQPYTPPRPPRQPAHELNALALAWASIKHFFASLFGRTSG
jgi:hypothetical protein